MNAFALILLSWPFYLAVNGRLSRYMDLAKPKQNNAESGGESSDSSPSLLDQSSSLIDKISSMNTQGGLKWPTD